MTRTVTTQFTATHGRLLLAVALDPKLIGERIAEARNKRGWTQLEFATQHAHVSPSTVARWEAGHLPPVRELMRIAEILGVSADTLIETPPPEALAVSQRLARLEAAALEDRALLVGIAVALGVRVHEASPEDEEPAI
jgi:transcriptional regulator with XRE-family HTH domain